MKTQQPIWKYIANLGDVSPIEYGGFFVYEDETGVYAPEAELLLEPSDDIDFDSPKARWEVRRFCLEKCTYQNGILSDNQFHPDHAAWFANSLQSIADTMGMEKTELLTLFLSDDARDRAIAWRCVGEYHGWDNLDEYPTYFTRAEIETRYKEELV
jgi:hypothetical protein